MQRKYIVIVTPALPGANSGNRQSAHRQARMLRGCHGVQLAATWEGGEEAAELRQGPGAPNKVQAALECPESTT